MRADPAAEQQPETVDASSVTKTQAGRMRAAVERVVVVAPSFLRGDVDADQMANTMLHAVRHYVEQEQALASDPAPSTAELQALQDALAELAACGSGYLAGRCDAACVARTTTQLVREFATG